MSDILTPVARLVSGHPMVSYPVVDNKTNTPKLMATGESMNSTSVGLAFPKGAETHWNQTIWGAPIWNAGMAAFPNGEFNAATFAWKVTDGDSPVPNKKGNKPCDNDGWKGHWVMFLSTMFSIPSYHVGRYESHQVIQDKNEIKTGDYVRASFNVTGNNIKGPTESPGVYLNPVMIEISRAGIAIVSANAPSATAAFGATAPEIPAGALIDNSVVTPAAAPAPAVAAQTAVVTPAPAVAAQTAVVTPTVQTAVVTPAHDLVQPQPTPGAVVTPPPVIAAPVVEESYIVDGKPFTKTQLLAMPGWTEAHLANLPKA